jgi:hypothetical protein
MSKFLLYPTFIIFLFGCSEKLKQSYTEIDRGFNEAQVIALMGKPHKISDCNKTLWWDLEFIGEDINHICKKTYWYGATEIEQWSIGFNIQGSVVSKYHHVSP